jgi:Protein of unknown function (DUF1488)
MSFASAHAKPILPEAGSGRESEEPVSIKFHSNHAIFDDSTDTVRIPAVDGNRLVVCAIEHAAIRKALPWTGDGPGAYLVATYRRFRHAFHLIAAVKYRLRLVEPTGEIRVTADDFPELDPPWDFAAPRKVVN